MTSDRAYYVFAILVVLIIGVIGGLSLHETFSGDQAMFLTYARAIDSGAVLYRDIWDLKQPAIFVFYLLGEKLFGFDEVGIHRFELIYFCGLALFLAIGLRRYFAKPLFALLAPLLALGAYYSVSQTWHLTQAEGLVCFPLFLSIWFCQKYLEKVGDNKFLVLAGVFGGIVLLFKLLFIGILVPIAICLLLYCYFCFRFKTRKLLAVCGWPMLGMLIPIGLVVLYFARHDSLSILWYTTFEYPYKAAALLDLGERSQILKEGAAWFAKSYFPLIALTLVLGGLKIKSLFAKKAIASRDLDARAFLFAALSIWVVAGTFVILIQRFSWWEYQYSLLMLPLGVLGAKGMEALFQEVNTRAKHALRTGLRVALVIVTLLLFIPLARRLELKIAARTQMKTIQVGQTDLPLTGNVEVYQRIAAETRFLAVDEHPPKIFVFCNPLYYRLSNTLPAISTNGWMPDGFTDVEWKKLDREMQASKPKYVFFEKNQAQVVRDRDPAFTSFIDEHYSVYSTSDSLVIYSLNEPTPPAL